MAPRNFVLAVSVLAVLAGAGIAIIALAFLVGGEEESGTRVVATSPTATLAPPTITPTPQPHTPEPPPPTTIGAAPKPTFTPTVPAPPATPTVPPTFTPRPEPTEPGGPSPGGPSPAPPPPPAPGMPDLAVLDLAVSDDRVAAVIGNIGGQSVPPGTTVQLALRGRLAHSRTLPQGLSPGASFTVLLAEEFVYQPEFVTAVVDPNTFVSEANETNNSLTRQLEPDILMDLALTGLSPTGAMDQLLVSVRNNSPVPARQVSVRLSVYGSGSGGSLLTAAAYQLDLEPQSTVTLAPGVSAVRGLSLRVVLEVTGLVDGNPANNVVEALVQ